MNGAHGMSMSLVGLCVAKPVLSDPASFSFPRHPPDGRNPKRGPDEEVAIREKGSLTRVPKRATWLKKSTRAVPPDGAYFKCIPALRSMAHGQKSKKKNEKIPTYLFGRPPLYCSFLTIDSRFQFQRMYIGTKREAFCIPR